MRQEFRSTQPHGPPEIGDKVPFRPQRNCSEQFWAPGSRRSGWNIPCRSSIDSANRCIEVMPGCHPTTEGYLLLTRPAGRRAQPRRQPGAPRSRPGAARTSCCCSASFDRRLRSFATRRARCPCAPCTSSTATGTRGASLRQGISYRISFRRGATSPSTPRGRPRPGAQAVVLQPPPRAGQQRAPRRLSPWRRIRRRIVVNGSMGPGKRPWITGMFDARAVGPPGRLPDLVRRIRQGAQRPRVRGEPPVDPPAGGLCARRRAPAERYAMA